MPINCHDSQNLNFVHGRKVHFNSKMPPCQNWFLLEMLVPSASQYLPLLTAEEQLLALTEEVHNVLTFSSSVPCGQQCLKPAILWLEMEIRELLIFRSLGVSTVFWVQFSFLVTLGRASREYRQCEVP